MLFYRLAFHAIGYRGSFTDYSAPGWPIRDYPEKSERPPNKRLQPTAADAIM
jgi:hypothetical protein